MINSGSYFILQGNQWTVNYTNTLDLISKLKLNINISEDDLPLSLGTAFWFRTKAFKKIFDLNWIQFLHSEPTLIDGDINHSIERIIPWIVKDEGFLTGTIYTPKTAKNLMIIDNYMLNLIIGKIRTIEGNDNPILEDFIKDYTKSHWLKSKISKLIKSLSKTKAKYVFNKK